MNWILVVWPMVVASAATLAFVHLCIWHQNRAANDQVCFAVAAASVAILGVVELQLMHAVDIAAYIRWHFVGHVAVASTLISLVWLFRVQFKVGPLWLPWALTAMRVVLIFVAALLPYGINFREITGLSTVVFGGATIVVPDIVPWQWSRVPEVITLLWIGYMAASVVTTWRRGEHRRSYAPALSIMVFLCYALANTILINTGIVHVPYMMSLGFLLVILPIGYGLSADVAKSALLSRALQRREEELAESAQRMRLASEAGQLGLWALDFDTNIFWGSPQARRMFAYADEEVVNLEHFLERVHPEDRLRVKLAVQQLKEHGGNYAEEYRIILPGNVTRWIAARGQSYGPHPGHARKLNGVIMDVTERKRLDADTAELRLELTHIARVATLGELAASLSHELNQPLAAILSNAQAARRFLAAPVAHIDEVRAILDDIVADDKRASEVIQKLRALVQKGGPNEPDRVPVGEILQDAERLLHGELVSHRVGLDSSIPLSLPAVLVGRVELQQVLLNLILNAVDAMNTETVQHRKISISAAAEGRRVRISVRDHGPGIADDAMANIFRPFYTTKAQGLGMGLAICRSLIESYDGTLRAENHPEGGAVFHIDLPAAT